MKVSTLLYAFAAAALLFSCQVKEPAEVSPADSADIATKVVQLGDQWEEDSFLVKFRSVPSDGELEVYCRDGVLALKPVFTSFSGKEALEREFGLDRWYSVSLEEGTNLHKAIRRFAALETVSQAQYACLAVKASDEVAYPAFETETKAAMGGQFNDPMLGDQWNYNNQGSKAFSNYVVAGADVNVKDVWNRITCGDPEIIVAVVDEGVKYSHPDLKANIWSNPKEIAGNGIDDDKNGYVDDVYGFNFVTATRKTKNDPWENGAITWDNFYKEGNKTVGDSGHGTHCAGTIAAVNNNGTGVSGIAGGTGNGDGCRIMSCQIFSGPGGAPSETIATAIKYAADMGASIISCSFGTSTAFPSDNSYYKAGGGIEIDAIHYFEASKNNPVLDGNIAVFAASNDSHPYAHYPGAWYDIISVSAFGPDFLPAYYTNYGPGCNISAPGGEYLHGVGDKSAILSTVTSERYNSDYGYMQGTSMACPHMAGVVALGLSYAKQLGKKFTRQEFKELLLASANDIDQRIAKTKDKPYSGIKDLAPYYHQMGTGAIDAWRVMMHIEGIPTLTAQLGKKQWIDLTPIFGTASVSLTYLEVEVPDATASALGLNAVEPVEDAKYPAVEASGKNAFVQFGRLYIEPTKLGSGKLRIKAVGGGDHLGGGDNPPGGMELDREISLIVRDVDGGNGIGGWL